MNHPLLIAKIHGPEYCECGGSYIVSEITPGLVSSLREFEKEAFSCPYAANISFYCACFGMFDYPSDLEETDPDTFSMIDGMENDFLITSEPSRALLDFFERQDYSLEFQYAYFKPNGVYRGEFQFRCNLKYTSHEFATPMIKISDLENALPKTLC